STGGSSTVLVPEGAAKKVLVPTGAISNAWKGGAAFDDSGWNDATFISGKTGGFGYDGSSTYRPYISYDVESKMRNSYTGCYARILFSVDPADLAEFDSMTLKVRYDDGFVAYLNGAELDRSNVSGDPDWDSTAAENPDGAAVVFESFDVTDNLSDLRAGDNILALHGVNKSTGSSDFLCSVELVASESGIPSGSDISPSAIAYSGPRTFDKSVCVKARLKSGSTWSALNKAIYAVGPVAESLRISEIMYHPQETGDPNDPNEEFIELTNVGAEAINLNLASFTNGIDFTFGDVELAAGDCVVVVKNADAFASRYPAFIGVIAGEYAGSLNNGGERIELADAAGKTILNFEYKDGWRRITDGLGYSLTNIDPSDSTLAVPEEGLVGHWAFDDGSGSVATDSVGSNHGTVHGAAQWTSGQMAGALDFDGIDDHVSLSSIGALAGNSMTIEAWVYLNDIVYAFNPVLTQHTPGGNGYYFYLYDSQPTFSLVDGAGYAEASASEVLGLARWYHLAGTNDGVSMRIYVDGRLRGSASSLGLTGASYDSHIAYDLTEPTYYKGAIDNVRIYSRALSEYEFAGRSDWMQRWSDKDSWRASAYIGGSPGYDDSGSLPNPGDIVINEILAHSHGAEPDWIELHNTTGSEIDIGGWYLSDSQFILKKYRFADGTKINAHDYLLLYEDANFGDFSTDPGKIVGFGFSENGDQAYLSSAEGDTLTGYRAVEDFGASFTGISFGRYYKTSTDSYNFVPMDHNTPGYANAYPAVGPVVISEIMYNPDWPAGGMYANDRYEYIELHNITDAPVKLYRDDKALPWKFSEGIEYVFPDYPNEATIGAHDYIVVVRDVNAFTWRYPGVPAAKIYGPYDGRLDNAGERLEISMPGDIDMFGRQYYIRIDRVTYSDGAHPGNGPGDIDLWPVEPDGAGKSLARTTPNLYGNDPNNWTA
ncbi:MAG: lamin tail domain-containing protein, partial [Planctomycetota bacterium]